MRKPGSPPRIWLLLGGYVFVLAVLAAYSY